MLIALIFLYFQWNIQRCPARQSRTTQWTMLALLLGAWMTVLHMLATTTELLFFDLLAYTRSLFGTILAYVLARALYALPPTEPFARHGEERIYIRVAQILVAFGGIYWLYRVWQTLFSGAIPSDPLLPTLPLIFMFPWTLLLLWRKWWAAEDAPSIGLGHRLYRMFVDPRNSVSHFYRLFGVIVAILLGVAALASVTATSTMPLWLMVTSDLVVSACLFVTAYSYMRYELVLGGLELRIIGAGMMIFVGLVSVMGWVITLSYVHQLGDPIAIYDIAIYDIAIYDVVGSQFNLLFTTPPQHQALAATLSRLLQPLIWFEIGGSLIFVLIFASFYRRTLKVTLRQIIGGFEEIQRGNLAYRLSPLPWDDEFSHIVLSFNRMAYSLERSNDEVQTYQAHLEDLVTQRTAQLAHEIEVRKNLEVRQGIQAERARIARDTHDGLLQTLLGLRIRLNRAPRLSRQEASILEHELLDLSAEVTQAAQDLRNLINDLSADILKDGLVAAFQQIVERYERSYPVTLHLNVCYPAALLNPAQEHDLVRIAQEAISNLCRHSNATAAWIDLRCDPLANDSALVLTVRDDGDGFDPLSSQGAGRGLKNMQQRADLMGATLSIESRPGAGTTVRLTAPLLPLAVERFTI